MNKTTMLVALAIASLTIKAAAQQPASDAERFRQTATQQDIMMTMVDPAADRIWSSVSTVISDNRVVQIVPRSDQDWEDIRKAAVQLRESGNLMLTSGRRVARSGEKSKNPNIELEPEEIQVLIQKNPADWADRVRNFQ